MSERWPNEQEILSGPKGNIISQSSASWGRRGVTLIECLSVVFVIGLLISMLLPAVQAARETARRSQCTSHLQQIGLALRNYEVIHNVLPPGTVEPSGPVANTPLGFQHSWTLAILPWFNAGATAHVRYDKSVYSPPNLAVLLTMGTSPPEFRCPSNPSPFVQSHYAGCHDDRDKPIDEDDHGVFFRNSAVRSRDIPDGTAHTIYVGEKLSYAPDWGWMSGTRATLRTAGIPILETLQAYTERGKRHGYGSSELATASDLACTVRPDLFDYHPGIDFLDSDQMTAAISDLTGPELPEDPQAIEQICHWGEIPEGAPVIGGFASEHAGVTNFLFGDMSVRVIRHQIDPKIFRSLGNCADGEGIDESF